MTWYFINDENLVPRALLDEKPRMVWINIAENGHRLVVTRELYAKYLEKLEQTAHKAASVDVASIVLAILRDIQVNSEMTIMYDVSGRPSPWRGIVRHMTDWFLADLAFEVTEAGVVPNLVLVTTDRATRRDFNRPELAQRNIQGVTIEGGLDLSRER